MIKTMTTEFSIEKIEVSELSRQLAKEVAELSYVLSLRNRLPRMHDNGKHTLEVCLEGRTAAKYPIRKFSCYHDTAMPKIIDTYIKIVEEKFTRVKISIGTAETSLYGLITGSELYEPFKSRNMDSTFRIHEQDVVSMVDDYI
jgi:hypothetical protein